MKKFIALAVIASLYFASRPIVFGFLAGYTHPTTGFWLCYDYLHPVTALKMLCGIDG